MKAKVFAVIDTNVFVSALISSNGYPNYIFELVQNENVIPVYDKRVLQEYYEVFHYEKLKIDEDIIKDTLYTIASKGILIKDCEKATVEFRDKSDIPFFEIKESTKELDSRLITGNLKHYPNVPNIVTPKEFLNIFHGIEFTVEALLKKDIDYEKDCKEAIARITSSDNGKYISGTDILNDMFEDVENRIINNSYFDYDR